MRLAFRKQPAILSATSCYVLLSLLCLALYLPGIARIPPTDRDEAMFAEASREMVETGDWVRPRFQSRALYQKPIGIYWLQAAAVTATGTSNRARIWTYRIPSVVGGIAAVLTTFWIGERLFGEAVGLLGAGLLAASAVLIAEATLGTTDAMLLACVTWAEGCLAMIYLWPRRHRPPPARYAVGLWVSLGLGVLMKGPVIVGVIGLTVFSLAVWDRDRIDKLYDAPYQAGRLLKDLRWWWGIPLTAAIVAPWAVAVAVTTRGEFYRQAFLGDIWPKLISGQEGHFGLPGYYILAAVATFWPGSLLAGFGLLRAFQRRTRPRERMLLAWLVPSWIAFELMPTKLPHYTLPTYPALALLTARAVLPHCPVTMRSRLLRPEAWVWCAVTLLAAFSVIAAPIIVGRGFSWLSLIPGAAAIAIAIVATRLSLNGHMAQAAWLAIVGAVAVAAPLRHWVIPGLDRLWLSRGVAIAVAAERGAYQRDLPVAAVGYHEPSLVFLLGTRTQMAGPQDAVAFLQANPLGLVVVSGQWEGAFKIAAQRDGMRVRELWSTTGINYSKGQKLSLKLFARLPTVG